ncbi:MAG: aminotransferase class V-fold PLP-dependent enzyme [Actinomycetota bacterium]|nr:aminotransferase class V-fold PLP-dependent enzyme [Actinomycetota bacterium]
MAGTPPSIADAPDTGTPTRDAPLAALVGAGADVPCVDGTERRYRDLDCAASTPAMAEVAARVEDFLPMYSSVHRGAGYKSRAATAAYEHARQRTLEFAGRAGGDDVAVICRNTTEALNHLAFRLALSPRDVVVTTVVEHHANLLPWARYASRRYVECDGDGVFGVADVVAALDAQPAPKLLAVTGASNVTGWLPPIGELCDAAHERGIPVVCDAAQLAPHRPLPNGPDFLAFSGHKLYAPFGAGALVGPRSAFEQGEPFLAGGGAVDLVDLDEVIWTDPPEREEAGSPNVIGTVALGAALDELERIGWERVIAHEARLARRLVAGLAGIDGVRLLGPARRADASHRADVEHLAVATFTVDGLHHALVAARLSAEWGIGVRHGCFCAHPYLLRLLGLGAPAVAEARRQVMAGDRRQIPGAVRASCGLGTTLDDVDALVDAVGVLASGAPAPVPYEQDPATGDFWPVTEEPGWTPADRAASGGCARG